MNDVTPPRLAAARFEDKDTLPRRANAVLGWASDAVAEMLRRLDVRYVALLPGSSFRGLHDSLVNYLGNQDPKMLLCLHEEHTVAIAQGYAAVTGRPMAAVVHSNVGLLHASMAVYNAWCARQPVLLFGATGPGDADQRRPWIDWIHTAKDQGAILRNFTKWDDEPRSVPAAIESVLRAHQMASTPPYGPAYICLDVALQESAIPENTAFPDVARFAPGPPPAPAPETVEQAARLLAGANKPVMLVGRVSRDLDDWNARVMLAEAIGCAVLTDNKAAAGFPTDHPLHPYEPRMRPSPQTAAILREADVVLSLDCIDLKGAFHLALGRDATIHAKVIHCSVDRFVHNGWSMDHQGLPPVDLPILSTPDQLTRPLTAAIRGLRGTDAPAAPKFPPRKPPDLGAPRASGMMGLRDLALVVRDFIAGRAVTATSYSLGYPMETVSLRHPLDFLGGDGGGGVGAGPGIAVGAALALKDSGRLPLAVIGDGDYLMASSALWTAVHMGIPLLVVIANNRSYYNDVAHQERVAVTRARPVENKFIGQEIDNPPVDLVAIARGYGAQGEGPVETSAALAAALARGEAAVRAGSVYVIDARIHVGYADEVRQDHTAGRKG
jgi:benzoylformate decarboxylase